MKPADWRRVLQECGCRPEIAARWSPVFARQAAPERFSQGTRELADFVGQVLHETGMLRLLVEDLNYSAARLCEVWPVRFPTESSAVPYAFAPQALARKVYGGRLGNLTPADAERYIGRGIPMVTGRANYALLEDLTGLPLLDYPVLLEDPDTALLAGVHWWEKRVPDSAIGSCARVTRAVQGGQQELDRREVLTAKARRALKELAAC